MFRVKTGLCLSLALCTVLTLPATAVRADARADQLVALVNQGWGLIAQHKDQEAIAPLEQALAMTGDPKQPSPETAYVMKALGNAYANMGRFDQAETYDRGVVEIEAAAFGPDDAKDMEGLAALGIVYAQQNKLQQGTPYFEKALAIAEAKLPPDSPQLAFCLNLVGQAYLQTGKKAEGQKLLARAAAIQARH